MHELPDPETVQERCEGQIFRVTTTEARVLFERWCAGAATITVPRLLLQQALDLAPHQLLGARLSAVIDTAALDDRQVRPHDWRLAEQAPGGATPARVLSLRAPAGHSAAAPGAGWPRPRRRASRLPGSGVRAELGVAPCRRSPRCPGAGGQVDPVSRAARPRSPLPRRRSGPSQPGSAEAWLRLERSCRMARAAAGRSSRGSTGDPRAHTAWAQGGEVESLCVRIPPERTIGAL